MDAPLLALTYFLVVASASTAGALSGIGGGIIIKPVLDLLGTMDVRTASFLSGCTVLAMASVSLLRSRGGEARVRKGTSLYLASGAAAGGILGREVLQRSAELLEADELLGIIQAATLLLINVGVFLFMARRASVASRDLRSKPASLAVGLALGLVSSFLGIGGGPLNIAGLYFLYSMRPKETALNSLFIIFCSQLASLASSLITRTIPAFPPETLLVMCAGGVAGSLLGSRISRALPEAAVERFFRGMLLFMIALNVFNIARFAAG